MIIERFRQEREKQQREIYKQSPEGAPPTLKYILGNPVYSEMLMALLEKDGQSDIQEKLVNREELNQDDFEQLDQYRTQIKEALDRTKEVLDIINTPEKIELMASCSPEFANIVGRLGPEETLNFLKNYMALIYVKNPESFDDLSSKIENIIQAEQQLQSLEQQIKDFAEAHKIPSNIIEQFHQMAAGNRIIAEQFLLTNIKRNLSLIGKIRDFISGGKFSGEYFKSLNKIEEIENQLKIINENLGEIGNMMAEAINSVGLSELSRLLYGERIEQPSFSFKDAGNLMELYSNENLEREWQEYLRSLGQREWPESYIKNGFESYLKSKSKNKGGRLFDWLFGPNGPLGKQIKQFLSGK